MISIDQKFARYPKKTLTVWQKVRSASTKTETITNRSLAIQGYLQPKSGLVEGIIQSANYTFYVDKTQLNALPRLIDYEDKLKETGAEYSIIDIQLHDGHWNYNPFYELILDKIRTV